MMRSLSLIICGLILFSAVISANAVAQTAVTIHIHRDAVPVSGIDVTVNGQVKTTDSSGDVVYNLLDGTYEVGFLDRTETIQVDSTHYYFSLSYDEAPAEEPEYRVNVLYLLVFCIVAGSLALLIVVLMGRKKKGK